jgi:hypothetical protein
MNELEKKFGIQVPTKELKNYLSKSLSKKEINRIIKDVFCNAECFFPKKDYIQRI